MPATAPADRPAQRYAVVNFRACVENTWQDQLALVINGDQIEQCISRAELPHALPRVDCGARILTPGFVDSQVNGGGGLMFNQAPTVATLDCMRRAHWSGGTTSMLPTLITDSEETMDRAVDAVAEAIDTLPGILGIHLEGPHLSVARKGVHQAASIRPFSSHTNKLLRRMPAAHYLVTVAPENMPTGAIAELSRRGIKVSAGHTAASYDCIRTALAEGLCCFTHLHNAMSAMTSREPGVVGAALEDAESYVGLIVDGFHVHPATARVSIAAKSKGKTLLVTDAMATVGTDKKSFELYGESISVMGGRCSTADGTLAGSALDMVSAVRNCVTTLGIPLQEALRMASQYPAQFMQIDNQLGFIRPGHQANFVLLNEGISVHETWLQGDVVFRSRVSADDSALS